VRQPGSVRRRAIPSRRSQLCSRAARASRSVSLLAPLAAMFAWLPPSSSELAERKSVVPPHPPADRRREHRESVAVVVARGGKNASARSSSVRRRAIPDARSTLAVRAESCPLSPAAVLT
jgi:hypothetical protein